MSGWLNELFGSEAFLNGFWVFVGVVAGALIQYLLGYITTRKQARNALEVLKIELRYNCDEVEEFLNHIDWLRTRISAGQLEQADLNLPMNRFDYSTIGPLSNSGYFHLLLGPDNLRKYLEFVNFFRNDNAQILTAQLRLEHQESKSLQFLEWVEERAAEISEAVEPLAESKLSFWKSKIKLPKD